MTLHEHHGLRRNLQHGLAFVVPSRSNARCKPGELSGTLEWESAAKRRRNAVKVQRLVRVAQAGQKHHECRAPHAGDEIVRPYGNRNRKKQGIKSLCDNTKYEGEIQRIGDAVHIRRTPDINVNPYQVGMTITYQVPDVAGTELIIDQGLYWAFQIDNVDRYQSDIDLMDDFTQDAVQKTMNQQDQKLLATIPGQVSSINQGVAAGLISANVNLGAAGAPLTITSGNVVDSVLLAAGQVLDEAKVPRDGKRWIVLPSWMLRKMKNSELKFAYETGDAVSPLRNGRVGRTDDFLIYQSNNILPVVDASRNAFNCPFGHPAGLTWASQFIDTDAVKLTQQIGTGVYSVCAYGFKVTEPTYLGNVYATPGVG